MAGCCVDVLWPSPHPQLDSSKEVYLPLGSTPLSSTVSELETLCCMLSMHMCRFLKPLPTWLMRSSCICLRLHVITLVKQLHVALAITHPGLDMMQPPCLAVTGAPDNLSSQTQSQLIALCRTTYVCAHDLYENYTSSLSGDGSPEPV